VRLRSRALPPRNAEPGYTHRLRTHWNIGVGNSRACMRMQEAVPRRGYSFTLSMEMLFSECRFCR